MHRDANCVYVANSPEEADVVAVWLEEQGFPARVMNASTLAGLPSLYSPVETDAGGIEVWVLDEAKAPLAKQLLVEHSATLARQAIAAQQGQPVQVRCEACGQTAEFPAKDRGSVQECPHCGEYLDVGVPPDDESPDAISADEDDAE
jgi:predicted RNA-binding Zn-ribbon protein involved in translation (DUF1610 family)